VFDRVLGQLFEISQTASRDAQAGRILAEDEVIFRAYRRKGERLEIHEYQ
jgi:hypothetical protein